jgi:hypothetical protein
VVVVVVVVFVVVTSGCDSGRGGGYVDSCLQGIGGVNWEQDLYCYGNYLIII